MYESLAFVAFMAMLGVIFYCQHRERMAIIDAYRRIIEAAQGSGEPKKKDGEA